MLGGFWGHLWGNPKAFQHSKHQPRGQQGQHLWPMASGWDPMGTAPFPCRAGDQLLLGDTENFCASCIITDLSPGLCSAALCIAVGVLLEESRLFLLPSHFAASRPKPCGVMVVGGSAQPRSVLLGSSAPPWGSQCLHWPHHGTGGVHSTPGRVGGHEKSRFRRGV